MSGERPVRFGRTADDHGDATRAAPRTPTSSAPRRRRRRAAIDVTPGTLSFGAAGGSSSAYGRDRRAAARGRARATPRSRSVTGRRDGIGSGTVTYQVAAIRQPRTRTATLTIAGQTFTVTQAAATCTYSLDSGERVVPRPRAGNGSVTVTTLGWLPGHRGEQCAVHSDHERRVGAERGRRLFRWLPILRRAAGARA